MISTVFFAVMIAGAFMEVFCPDPAECKRREMKARHWWRRGMNKYPAVSEPIALESRGKSFEFDFMYCKGAHRLKARRYR